MKHMYVNRGSTNIWIGCVVSFAVAACGADERADDGPIGGGISSETSEPTGPEEGTISPAPPSVLMVVQTVDGRGIASAMVEARCEGDVPPVVPVLPGTPRMQAQRTVGVTDSGGLALFEGLPLGRCTFAVSADGFSSAVAVAVLGGDSALMRTLRLVPTIVETFDAGTGASIGLPELGMNVEVPGGSLVYASGTRAVAGSQGPVHIDLAGQPVEGMVVAELAAWGPGRSEPSALPGPMIGRTADGQAQRVLTSAGMLEFRMTQDGMPVQLRRGAAAELTIDVDAKHLDPAALTAIEQRGTIAKWYLDPQTGQWEEEGSWTATIDAGIVRLRALQGHFTWVNADEPGIPHCFDVHVVDEHGNPLPNEPVVVDGWHKGVTDDDGTICAEFSQQLHFQDICGQEVNIPKAPDHPISACLGSWNLAIDPMYLPGKGDCESVDVVCPTDPVCEPNSKKVCTDVVEDSFEGKGLCHEGMQICLGGWKWSDCSQPVQPVEEVCGGENALDEDCDGQVDEKFDEKDELVCTCDLGDMQACYPGPAEQMGTGICHAGTQACIGAGDWTSCSGDVQLPELENCATADADEDCDGDPQCHGEAAWIASVSQKGFDVFGVAVAARDAVVAGLQVNRRAAGDPKWLCAGNELKLDGEPGDVQNPELGPHDALVVGYDADGACAWVDRIGGKGHQVIGDIIYVDSEKNVPEIYVVGHFTGTIDADEGQPDMCGAIVGDATPRLFLAKYDDSGHCLARVALSAGAGEVRDARLRFVPARPKYPRSLVAVARADGDLTFKGMGCKGLSPEKDGLILNVSLDPKGLGDCLLAKVIGADDANGERTPTAVAVNAAGDLAVAGYYQSSIYMVDSVPGNGDNAFAAHYSGDDWNDTPRLLLAPDAIGTQRASGIAFGAENQVIVGGYTEGALGLTACDQPEFQGDARDGFLTIFAVDPMKKAAPVNLACARTYGDNDDRIGDLAAFNADAQAHMFWAGTTAGPSDVFTASMNKQQPGCSPGVQGAGDDGLAGRMVFDPNDPAPSIDCVWSQRYPEELVDADTAIDGTTSQIASRVASTTAGAAVLTGWFESGFGLVEVGKLTNVKGDASARNAYVVKLQP